MKTTIKIFDQEFEVAKDVALEISRLKKELKASYQRYMRATIEAVTYKDMHYKLRKGILGSIDSDSDELKSLEARLNQMDEVAKIAKDKKQKGTL